MRPTSTAEWTVNHDPLPGQIPRDGAANSQPANPEDPAREAFGMIYREHHTSALRLAYLLCGNADRAEEAVAEAFCKVYPHWRRGNVTDAGPYVRRAVVNELRSRGRRHSLELRENQRRRVEGRVEDVAMGAVERERVLTALRRLPIRQRAAIVLRYYADLSEAEVASTLGISIGTVKSSVSRGLDRLRPALRDRDGDHIEDQARDQARGQARDQARGQAREHGKEI